VKIVVNGIEHDVDVPGDVPLLWVLREELGLTGTKFGCGQALCGACTVHVDGEARRSCVTPIEAVAGKSITTIEGLASREALHVLQQAWIEENVPQCGYCQPGQLMAAAGLLAAKPRPTDDEIDAVMSASLCRCGTYPRIRKAIHRAAGTGRSLQEAAGGLESAASAPAAVPHRLRTPGTRPLRDATGSRAPDSKASTGPLQPASGETD
jgi:isoquinoline 1-oxidoreductase alpha subunit